MLVVSGMLVVIGVVVGTAVTSVTGGRAR